MLSVRLMLLVLATNLIFGDSLGFEPNDRIDQVLAVMMRMESKVDVLEKKMNGMEETVHTISNQISSVEKKVEKADSDVIQYTLFLGYKFVGRGWEGSKDD